MSPRPFLVGIVLATATPVVAQTSPAPAPTPAAVPAPVDPTPVDPTRLAAARPVIDAVWPMGTYARIMRATMDQLAGGAMGGLFGMKHGDFGVPAKPGDKTLGETMAAEDPYFRQRTEIAMRVMGDEMGKLMTELEPGIRDAMANSYARRFSVAQLGELDAFFRTPTGRIYANDSMLLMIGPDMMTQMQAFVPRMLTAMPAIMAKVDAATKHLPPPPTKKTDR